jgi:hypothetical protein
MARYKNDKFFHNTTLKKRTRFKSSTLVTKEVIKGELMENRVDMKSAVVPFRTAAL